MKCDETKIAMLLWNAQMRYQECRDGVLGQLRAEGFVEPKVSTSLSESATNVSMFVMPPSWMASAANPGSVL